MRGGTVVRKGQSSAGHGDGLVVNHPVEGILGEGVHQAETSAFCEGDPRAAQDGAVGSGEARHARVDDRCTRVGVGCREGQATQSVLDQAAGTQGEISADFRVTRTVDGQAICRAGDSVGQRKPVARPGRGDLCVAQERDRAWHDIHAAHVDQRAACAGPAGEPCVAVASQAQCHEPVRIVQHAGVFQGQCGIVADGLGLVGGRVAEGPRVCQHDAAAALRHAATEGVGATEPQRAAAGLDETVGGAADHGRDFKFVALVARIAVHREGAVGVIEIQTADDPRLAVVARGEGEAAAEFQGAATAVDVEQVVLPGRQAQGAANGQRAAASRIQKVRGVGVDAAGRDADGADRVGRALEVNVSVPVEQDGATVLAKVQVG